jgi:cholesterol transport system auxiliary component
LQIRYFDAEPPRARVTDERDVTGPGACQLELGDVSASDGLRESIAFRSSAFEVGYYEARRWRDSPDRYLRRAIEYALFESRGCRRIVSGPAPTLDVELDAFEELRGSPHSARVAVHMILHDEHAVMREDTVVVARVVAAESDGKQFEQVVRAISDALDDAAGKVARIVSFALRDGAARH